MKVAFLAPMALARDGIGIYSRELCVHLETLCRLEHFPLDAEVHGPSHFREMAKAVSRCDVLHVEHAHPFFKLPLYPFREAFLDFLRRVTVPRLVVYHEPLETAPLYYPPDGGTVPGRIRSALLYAAMAAARPVANAWWLPRHNREIFSLPERVVVHTEYRAAMVRRFAPGARVFVTPLSVYGSVAGKWDGTGGFVSPFGADDFVMTVFGFIDRRKDYVGILDAMLRLPPRFKLLVAGGCHDEKEYLSPGSPYGRLMAFAREHGLEGRVRVTGYCADAAIPGIMAASGVVVAPFTQNHSSGSVNMALAYAKPVIAYRTMLTEEMNRNGAGLLIVDGKEQLAGALLGAAAEPSVCAEAVRKGEGYRSAYGFRSAAERFARWYEEMLPRR